MAFVTLRLSNGHTIDVDNVTGGTYMQAAIMAGHQHSENKFVLGLYLMAVCVKRNGESVGIKYIKELGFDDLTTISEAIASQSFKVNGNG